MKRTIIVAVVSAFLLHCGVPILGDLPSVCWPCLFHFKYEHMSACPSDSPCTCNRLTVDCSAQNLSFVPFVGRTFYRYLNFSNNHLPNISHESFFSNVTTAVEVIDLFNNGLVYLSPAAFRGLSRLKILLLGGFNHLSYKDLPTLLSIGGGVSLDLTCLRLRNIPTGIFDNASRLHTQQLDFSWNQIPSLNMSAFQPLQSITYLSFWHNKIYSLETGYLPSLAFLDLQVNRLFEFPQTCSSSGLSLFPSLIRLSLDHNMIDHIKDPVCLPNLFFLSLNYNKILSFPTDMFSTTRFPSLSVLKVMQMEGKISQIQRFFMNNSQVTYLNFHMNQVDFSESEIHEDMFGGCSKLWRLFLRGNNFGGVPDDKFRRLFHPLRHSLAELDLAQTQMTRISAMTFSGLENLTEVYMYKNALPAIPDGAFDNVPRLTRLQLDNNYISTISETTFCPQLRKRFQALYLYGNPFHCSCSILWFQQWMRTDRSIFHDKYANTGYVCANVNNITLLDFVLNEQACILGSDAAAFTISIVCVFILFFLLFSLFFRFRWHVRLWLYEVCRGQRQRGGLGRHGRRYKYDVFVSYAEENVDWVDHHLLPVLEGTWGLRLCLRERDFEPSKFIMDNISDCMEDSERILLLFSPFFARSQWCQFELQLCQMCVMERDDVLVIVRLQAVRSRDMTGAMMAVLRTTTYVEWKEEYDEEEEEARTLFWQRLRLALEDM